MSDENFKFGKINLLIFEEYSFVSDILSEMLKNFGIRKIHCAKNLTQAKMFCDNSFSDNNNEYIDFAIVDLVPPNHHGLEFMNWVRHNKISQMQYMPIIFTTNDTRENIIYNVRDTGANEILVKPYTAYNVCLIQPKK